MKDVARLNIVRSGGSDELLFVMNVPDSPQPIIVQNRLAIAQENRLHAGIESLIGTRLNPTAKLATLSSYGRVLFDVLPEQVRRRLFESATPLAIDSRSTHLQWELVHNGQRFLCEIPDTARTVSEYTLVNTPLPDPSEWSVLIVSNPTSDLPQADEASEWVYRFLRSRGAKVRRPIRGAQANYFSLLAALTGDAYTLVHYFGHAGFDRVNGEGYLTLADGRFTASQLVDSIRGSPIVFVSACSSASTASVRPGDAAELRKPRSLPEAFLAAGARAYIGTTWPISDAGAAQFARGFYEALFEDYQTVGGALATARSTARASAADAGVDWASYVLYGAPHAGIGSLEQPHTAASGGANQGTSHAFPGLRRASAFTRNGISPDWLDEFAASALYQAHRIRDELGHAVTGVSHLLIALAGIKGGLLQIEEMRFGLPSGEYGRRLRIGTIAHGVEARPGSPIADALEEVVNAARDAARIAGREQAGEADLLAALLSHMPAFASSLRDVDGIDLQIVIDRANSAPHFVDSRLDERVFAPDGLAVLSDLGSIAHTYGIGLNTPVLLRALAGSPVGWLAKAIAEQGGSTEGLMRFLDDLLERYRKPKGSASPYDDFHRKESYSPRLLRVLLAAQVLAQRETAPVGERHLAFGMMAAGGGTAGDILSQHGVDTYRAVSWLREQFAAKPTYNTAPVHRLADETMRLLAAASRITVSHSRRVVSLADLVAASIEGELGFASAFWHASMANPAALTPLLRASPLNSELSAAASYVGGYEVSGLVARLFTLAEDARGGGAALRARISRASTGDEKQLTMRHVFIGFNRLVENGLADLPAPATDALRRLTGTLEAHPLFDDAGALLESRLDSGAIDALASSAKLLENTGHWLVDTRILTGVLLSVPGTSLDGGITPSEAAAVRMAGRRLLAPPADGGRSWKAALGTWQFNFSRNCQMTLLSAYDESVKHSSPVTTRAHLLLGVLNSPDRRAREFLSSQGVDPDALIELLSR